MQNIVEKLNSFRNEIVHIMANVSGQTEPQAEIILLIILGYIILIIILISIHRRLIKRQIKIHENLVLSYDMIRYQVAKAQYGNPAIQDNGWIKVVIDSEHENYLANFRAIKEEVLSIEQKLWQQIVSWEQRKSISSKTKKKGITTFFAQLIGIFITVITLGIYKLFR